MLSFYAEIADKAVKKKRTINALLIRELMLRFGHGNIGFMWLVGEPLILTVGVMIVWSFIYGEHNHGVRVIPLVLTGYTMLTLLRHMVNRFTHCFRQNSGLLFHRSVRPVDTMVARGLLEAIGVLVSFFVAYIPLYLLEITEPVYDFGILLSAWTIYCFLCFGFAMIIGSVSELSDTLERFIGAIMYLILPLTGVFYMVSWMPQKVQKVVLLSPLVHAAEMFRAGYFGPTVPTTWSIEYLALWALGLNTIGWWLVQYAQRNIEIE